MRIEKKHLLELRDLISEMEPNLDYPENVELCIERMSDLWVKLVFGD